MFIIIWNIHQFIVNCLIPSGPWFFWWLCLETFGYSTWTFICFTPLGWVWNDLMLQCLDKTNMLMWLFEIILLWKLHLSHTYTYTHAHILSHTQIHTHTQIHMLITYQGSRVIGQLLINWSTSPMMIHKIIRLYLL